MCYKQDDGKFFRKCFYGDPNDNRDPKKGFCIALTTSPNGDEGVGLANITFDRHNFSIRRRLNFENSSCQRASFCNCEGDCAKDERCPCRVAGRKMCVIACHPRSRDCQCTIQRKQTVKKAKTSVSSSSSLVPLLVPMLSSSSSSSSSPSMFGNTAVTAPESRLPEKL